MFVVLILGPVAKLNATFAEEILVVLILGPVAKLNATVAEDMFVVLILGPVAKLNATVAEEIFVVLILGPVAKLNATVAEEILVVLILRPWATSNPMLAEEILVVLILGPVAKLNATAAEEILVVLILGPVAKLNATVAEEMFVVLILGPWAKKNPRELVCSAFVLIPEPVAFPKFNRLVLTVLPTEVLKYEAIVETDLLMILSAVMELTCKSDNHILIPSEAENCKRLVDIPAVLRFLIVAFTDCMELIFAVDTLRLMPVAVENKAVLNTLNGNPLIELTLSELMVTGRPRVDGIITST